MTLAETSFDLADLCDSMADEITTARSAVGYTESLGQGATLDHSVSSLRDEADAMRTAGVAASLESADAAIAQLNDATSQANDAVSKLKEANEMITVAGSLLVLAAAAATGNILGIATGAAALVSEVKEL
ncbi:hypothetical protein [Paraburkholderia sp. J76]|uniref:hypothetical protein n=1 Tax=Paraburkholderia sp. J76 TaxID=2805439 RepID=UPI002ABE1662|nr:hypothetical protein [Paraburkholderia sp. J76]